jgi:hypothetical protein
MQQLAKWLSCRPVLTARLSKTDFQVQLLDHAPKENFSVHSFLQLNSLIQDIESLYQLNLFEYIDIYGQLLHE